MSKRASNPVTLYLQTALEEWGKITWPTKEQAALLTAVTIIVSLSVAAMIGVLDLGFNELYQLILDQLS